MNSVCTGERKKIKWILDPVFFKVFAGPQKYSKRVKNCTGDGNNQSNEEN